MRWPFVREFWIARLVNDPDLISVMGYADFVFPASAAKPVKIPSIQYLKFGDTEEELFNPIRVQVDFWMRGKVKADQVGGRIYLLTHSDVAQELGGERMWMQ